MPLRLALVFALLMPTATLSQDLTRWQDLSGTWRGEGVLRAAPTADLEQGACRFTIRSDSDTALAISGRCATAAQTGQVSTTLSRAASGAITGSAISPLVAEPVSLRGRQTGARITLASTGPVAVDGQTYTVASRLDGLSGEDVFSLVQEVTPSDGNPIIVMQMRFTRAP
jgi:hypothetical protein